MTNNKVLGNKFEDDFAEFLSKQGFWVHFIEGSAHVGSQPFDIIAIKNDMPYCYDCKTLNNKNGLFPISRIEENQRLAFKKFRKCNNTHFSLAILWNNDLYIIPMDCFNFNKKSLDLKEYEFFINNKWKGFYDEN